MTLITHPASPHEHLTAARNAVSQEQEAGRQ